MAFQGLEQGGLAPHLGLNAKASNVWLLAGPDMHEQTQEGLFTCAQVWFYTFTSIVLVMHHQSHFAMWWFTALSFILMDNTHLLGSRAI